jgi:hypothetical protein
MYVLGRPQRPLRSRGGGRGSPDPRAGQRFDPTKVDYLFALVGNGRRSFIPALALEASRSLRLGGPKYAEFEIPRANPIEHLVDGDGAVTLESESNPGEYRSGQPGCAVNALAYAFAGSNPASPMVTTPTPKSAAGSAAGRSAGSDDLGKAPADDSTLRFRRRPAWARRPPAGTG